MKALLIAFSLIAAGNAQAGLTEKDLPKTPAPYGVYELNQVKWPRARVYETQDRIAQHYGYKDRSEAMAECRKQFVDCVDIVRHRRDESARAELAQFHFADWRAAVAACRKNIKVGDIDHCDVDPFLKLRMGK